MNEKLHKFFKKCDWHFFEVEESLYSLRDEINDITSFLNKNFDIIFLHHEVVEFIEYVMDETNSKLKEVVKAFKIIKKEDLEMFFKNWIDKKHNELQDNRIHKPKDIY
jgi:hypothetical protein